MVSLADSIIKGIDIISFFYSKYYGPIKFRPLTNMEIENVLERSFAGRSDDATRFIKEVEYCIKPTVKITKELLDEAGKIHDEIDKWIIYHGIKDFQPEEWQHVNDNIPFGIHVLNHPNSCLEFHELAREIMALSVRPREEIRSFIQTEGGDVLATAVWKLKYPITDKFWKMTPLQMYFVAECAAATSRIGKDGREKFLSMDELMKSIGFSPQRPMTKEETEQIKKWEEMRNVVRRGISGPQAQKC